MRKLRVLIVLTDPPLPFGNAGARWFYVLTNELVARGHRVTVFSGGDRPDDRERINQVFSPSDFDIRYYPACKTNNIGDRLLRVSQPYSYVFAPALRASLEKELERGYDVLHLEQLWSGWLGLKHRRRALINVHYSYSIDQSARPPQGARDRLMRMRTRLAERYLLKRYKHICTLSERLSAFVGSVNPAATLHTVPLGIDSSLYSFKEPNTEKPVIGLIGSFNWTPSYLAAQRLLERLWPAIRARRPDAKLLIAGRDAKVAFANLCRSDPGVAIEENVPDIIPYFRRMSVMLYAPSVGSGMKTKILEAFALGTPVITNTEGIEGLPVIDGIHAGVSDSDEGLVERVLNRLASPVLCRKQACSARELVESHCSPKATVDKIESAYCEVLQRG